MLKDFFKLNAPFVKFDEAQLQAHFATSNQVQNVLYEPDVWPANLFKTKGKTFENVSLSKTKFFKVTFTKCKFQDCLFIGCNFDDVEFHKCEFTNCNFWKSEFHKCYLDPRLISLDKSYRLTHANLGVGLFQALFDNLSAQNQTDFAREADIEFRRWKRAQLRHDVKDAKLTKMESNIIYTKSIVYETLAGFGYRPFRFMLWTIALFLIASIFNYFVLGSSLSAGSSGGNVSFADSVFYTFSVLTILGFSTVTAATDFAKIVTVFEALAAVGWLGILTSVLVKRFIR